MKELMPGIRSVQCRYDIFPVALAYDIFAVRRHVGIQDLTCRLYRVSLSS